MQTVRSDRIFWGSMGLLALLGLNGCTGTISTTGTAGINETAGTAKTASTGAVGNFFNPQALITAHNKWRTKVGVSGLKWSDTLARSSQSWADTLKGRCAVQHSSSRDYGENIYYAGPLSKISSSGGTETSPQQISSEKVVDTWGEEKKWYDHRYNSCHGGECGHYTQVVWKNTAEVGCGMAYCNDDAQIWVCQYKEAGNLRGQKPY